MILLSNLPKIKLSQLDGKIDFYDINKYKNTNSKHFNEIKFFDFLEEIGNLSPYLQRISKSETQWLHRIKEKYLNDIINELILDVRAFNLDDLVRECRLIKRRIFLITSIFDISGYLSLDHVSLILTYVADFILSVLSKSIIYEKEYRSVLDNKNINHSISFFILAMGKMGSYELNYSSDIDIIIFNTFDNKKIDDQFEAKQKIIKKFRKLVRILTDTSTGDFIYRVDLRLRPDPSSTPIVTDTNFAESYYQNLGRTWERMAFIKARPVSGNILKGKEFLSNISSFIWRNHFDYAAIDDVKNLREKMKLNSTHLKSFNLSGYNIKIGIGGIRDIELFTQTYQLVVAGRQQELRGANTILILKKLKEFGWLDNRSFETLVDAYILLRTTENRLQIINNTQTQSLPNEKSIKFKQLASLMGFNDCINFRDLLLNKLKAVKTLTDDFFSNLKFRKVQNNTSFHVRPLNNRKNKFDRKSNIDNSLHSEINSLKNNQIFKNLSTLRSFNALIPIFIKEIKQFDNQTQLIRKLEVFFKNISTGSQLFPLLENNPTLVKTLLIILNSSNLISQKLSYNVELLDLLVSKKFLDYISSKDILAKELKLRFKYNNDFEFIINELRRFVKERKFQISIHLILGKINCFHASKYFSDTAEICIEILLPVVKKNLKTRYGYPVNHLPCVLGMGKLGSSEMNFFSDLDLILIYDPFVKYKIKNQNYNSLEKYFARFTQALVSAFTSLTQEGKLYNVDMRLRPSGRKGPVATSISSFLNYQINKAWVWEHMALSRARIITGDTKTKSKLNKILFQIFDNKTFSKNEIKKQTLNMRLTLQNNYSKEFNPPDIKYGRGGFQELELLVQMGMLLMNIGYKKNHQSPKKLIVLLFRASFLNEDEFKEISLIYDLFFNYQQVICIMSDKIDNKEILSNHGLQYLFENFCKSINYEKGKNLNDLYLLLKQKSKYIGNLFDKKLK